MPGWGRVASSSDVAREAAVAKLVGLGFEPAAARQALEAAGGSEELAVDILVG